MTPPHTDEIRQRYDTAGQGHVFAWWDELETAARKQLCAEAAEVDLDEVAHLVRTHLKEQAGPLDLEGLEPAPYLQHPDRGGDPVAWNAAIVTGEELLRAGRVAAFTVAGGQGTRLGYDGPKGTFPVTPVRGHTLFQLFAEKLRAASQRYQRPLPWFIMTSHANHQATVDFFTQNGYFGLAPDDVHFFTQGRMPAVDANGKILMADKGSIALSPDGHGGSLRALVRSGAVQTMRDRGIDTLSYFQVDNPLVQVIDAAFLGFHARSGSEMSSKMLPKRHAREKLGHFCVQDGKTVVVEYSDMPDTLADQTDAEGQLRYRAGSIAIHVLDVDFVARVGGGDEAYALPFHRAHKKVKHLGADGQVISPDEPNAYKFEMFVFDALPYAENPVIIETLREDDFSPVKNADGDDSPQTARDDQRRQFARWFAAAGQPLETDETGLPEINLEVGPLFADRVDVFVEAWQALDPKPATNDGLILDA